METAFVSVMEVLKAGGSVVSVLLNIVVLWRLRDMQKCIDELSQGKRWSETCDERHEANDKRVDALWKKVFNGGTV